jgi:hypothetical protein
MLFKMLLGVIFLLALAPHAEARKVQMAVATFSQSVLPLVVAQEKRYYKEEDLDVQLILMTASVGNMALLGGNVDFNGWKRKPGTPEKSGRSCSKGSATQGACDGKDLRLFPGKKKPRLEAKRWKPFDH